MISVEKIETNNPFVDLLVYYTKLISLNLVIKNSQNADLEETVESSKQSDLFIACVEHTARLDLFDYIPKSILKAAEIPDPYKYDSYMEVPTSIPFQYQRTVLRLMEDYYAANYVEQNAYYRQLNGLPPLSDIELSNRSKLDPSIEDPLIDVSGYLSMYGVSSPCYIHECNESYLSMLNSSGVTDLLIKEYPDKEYLKYLRDGRINIYNARKASKFQILRTINIDNNEILETYKSRYELARDYTLKTVYSDAYAFESDYYDSFITIFIIIQTMVDMISDVQSMIARKDVFDGRSIKWMFQSYGIPYYDEIPFKYQKRMLKNLHTLLKYKSSTQNIIDICSLFGFDDIQVFKYYLLKSRRLDDVGNYLVKTDDEGNEDLEANFELKFIKVPIEEFDATKYAKDTSSYLDYEEVAYSDKYWQEPGKQEEVKKEILKQEFTLEKDKYLSIDLVYNLAQLSFDVPYFYSMLLDKWNNDMEEMVIPYVSIPYISQNTFKLIDIFIYLISLSYEYYGFEDIIIDEAAKTMQIYGFNFGIDLPAFISDIREKAQLNRVPEDLISSLNTDTLTVSNFLLNPSTSNSTTITYEQLLNVFNTNKKIHDLVVYMMRTADNKRMYDIYHTIYKSLMLTEKTFDFFTNKMGAFPEGTFKSSEWAVPGNNNEFSIDPASEEPIRIPVPENYGSTFFYDGNKIEIMNADDNTPIDKKYYTLYNDQLTINKDESGNLYPFPNRIKVKYIVNKVEYERNLPTYYRYLLVKGEAADLCKSIEEIRSISDMEGRRKAISGIMNAVTVALDEYIDSEEFKYLYTIMPANTANVIQQYMMKIINFFKSFRIDIHQLGTIYKLDDRFNNLLRVIDDCYINTEFDKNELIPLFDYVDSLVELTGKEKISFLEKLKINRHFIESLGDLKDYAYIKDYIELWHNSDRADDLKFTDNLKSNSVFTKIDDLSLRDEVEIITY